jgi:hypothetical protein
MRQAVVEHPAIGNERVKENEVRDDPVAEGRNKQEPVTELKVLKGRPARFERRARQVTAHGD